MKRWLALAVVILAAPVSAWGQEGLAYEAHIEGLADTDLLGLLEGLSDTMALRDTPLTSQPVDARAVLFDSMDPNSIWMPSSSASFW